MKQYKLIKTYPGSPKLNHIVMKETNVPYYGNSSAQFHEIIIENQPEFWKEIIEKDYEILEVSLRRSDKHFITSALGNSGEYNLALLNCEGNSIHSIKRLSDGEIFTVGDKIKCRDYFYIYTIYEINTSEYNIGIYFKAKTEDGLNIYDGCPLKEISKVKQPLFTTEDGVDMVEGDIVYYVETEEEPELSFKVNEYTVLKYSGRFTSDSSLHSFSTKRLANEYIFLNKPCLSVNDVIKSWVVRNEAKTEQNLIELVKSKL